MDGTSAAAAWSRGASNALLRLVLSNFVVRVCETADLSCASPLSEVRGLTPEGLVEVDVPVGFSGFLELESDGQMPAVFYMRSPVFRDTVDVQPIATIPTPRAAQGNSGPSTLPRSVSSAGSASRAATAEARVRMSGLAAMSSS